MGAHQTEDRTFDLARLVGRGAVATSAALALAGTGAGLALATPGHGDGDGSGSSGWDASGRGSSGHGSSGHSADADSSGHGCRAGDDGLVGGLLGDLGLGGSGRDGGSRSEHCDAGASDSDDQASPSPSSSSATSDAGTQRVSATQAAQSAITNPDDVPPPPGETKVIDLPDHPAS